MTDKFSKRKRSEIMSKVRNKDSKIEIILRKALWKEGFRYRKNSTKYFGRPDVVMVKYKIVIFVDSCFWHGCKRHGSFPQARKQFWRKKIERNKERDGEVDYHYKQSDWKLFRVWEHDLEKNLRRVVEKILHKLNM